MKTRPPQHPNEPLKELGESEIRGNSKYHER